MHVWFFVVCISPAECSGLHIQLSFHLQQWVPLQTAPSHEYDSCQSAASSFGTVKSYIKYKNIFALLVKKCQKLDAVVEDFTVSGGFSIAYAVLCCCWDSLSHLELVEFEEVTVTAEGGHQATLFRSEL